MKYAEGVFGGENTLGRTPWEERFREKNNLGKTFLTREHLGGEHFVKDESLQKNTFGG